jgi:pimeloyl-ACP methyl ester carboxylesterase
LLYTLRYPERTRSVILDGAVALTMGSADSVDRRAAALDRDRRLQADGDCQATFPISTSQRLLARFGNGRIATIRHRAPGGGRLTLTRVGDGYPRRALRRRTPPR